MSQHTIDEVDIALVAQALRGESLTRGPWVEEFERQVAAYTGYRYGVAFSSATAALHGVMAMLVKPNEEVVVPAITFAATANAVLYACGRVRFADVRKDNILIDTEKLGNLSGVKVVVGVDFAGKLCDYQRLKELKERYGFRVVADASHSMGVYRGDLADLAVFSFHPVKTMTTGEGGMVVTNDEEEARWLRQFRSHGITREDCPKGFYKQNFLGFNYNITDIQAALGVSQLSRLDSFIKRRQEIASLYRRELEGVSGIQLPSDEPSAWHFFPIQLENREKWLHEIPSTNVHYIPVYRHPLYAALGYRQEGHCPVAEEVYRLELSLPIYPRLRDEEVQDICRLLRSK